MMFPNYLEEISILDACIRATLAFVVGIVIGMVMLWGIEEKIDSASKYELKILGMVNFIYERIRFIF